MYDLEHRKEEIYKVPRIPIYEIPLSWKPSKKELKNAGVKNLSYFYKGTSENPDLIEIFKTALEDKNHDLRKGFTTFYGLADRLTSPHPHNIAAYLSHYLKLPETTAFTVSRYAKTQEKQIKIIKLLYFSLLDQQVDLSKNKVDFFIKPSGKNLVADCLFFTQKADQEKVVLSKDDWNVFVFLTQWDATLNSSTFKLLYQNDHNDSRSNFPYHAQEKVSLEGNHLTANSPRNTNHDHTSHLRNLLVHSDSDARMKFYKTFDIEEVRQIIPLIFTEVELLGAINMKIANSDMTASELKDIIGSPKLLRKDLFGW